MLEATPEFGLNPASGLRRIAQRLSTQQHGYPVDDMIEVATVWVSELLGEEEIVAAREEFFAHAGKVFHDDSFFDARMSYFIEHFLFERPISGAGRTAAFTGLIPYQLFVRHAVTGTALEERTAVAFASLAQARHSLFQVDKSRPSGLVIKDLLIPQKIEIAAKADESYRAIEGGTIFQGFVFRLPRASHLGSGLIIHPQRAKAMINRHIKAARKSGSAAEYPLLCRLATLQLRHLRHRHVDAKTIYLAGPS